MSEGDTSTNCNNEVTLSRFTTRLHASFNHLSTILLDAYILTNIGHDFKT